MNAKQIKYMLILAREGSFSKAADALGISQPSLSQYVKRIEQEIGQPLFERTNGDVRITDAGRLYIESGRKVLDIERQMERALADLASHKTGSLIIGAAPYRAASMLPVIAAAFRRLHPGMHLIVREGTTTELLEGMEQGEYDFALTLLPADQRSFEWEKITEEELVLAVPAGHAPLAVVEMPHRRYPAVDAGVLNGQPMVMLTDAQFMQKQLEHLLADYKLTVSTAAVVKSLEAQIEMVKAGVGMALMPGGIERFCRDDSVTLYSFADELPKRQVVLMWRRGRKLSTIEKELKAVIHAIEW